MKSFPLSGLLLCLSLVVVRLVARANPSQARGACCLNVSMRKAARCAGRSRALSGAARQRPALLAQDQATYLNART
jgi:hypothetical protein